MRMFPGHTLPAIFGMYAITFFSLLDHGYRQRYADYRMQASISLLPDMRKNDRKEFLRQLEWASTDSDDMLYNEGTDDGMEKLRRIFEGK